MKYKKGDVILVLYPYREKTQIKIRPALILEVFSGYYKICQITSKNRSGQLKGVWILKDSPAGKAMNILTNSFINLSNTIDITEAYIKRKIGNYPDIESLLK